MEWAFLSKNDYEDDAIGDTFFLPLFLLLKESEIIITY